MPAWLLEVAGMTNPDSALLLGDRCPATLIRREWAMDSSEVAKHHSRRLGSEFAHCTLMRRWVLIRRQWQYRREGVVISAPMSSAAQLRRPLACPLTGGDDSSTKW